METANARFLSITVPVVKKTLSVYFVANQHDSFKFLDYKNWHLQEAWIALLEDESSDA